MVDVTDLLVVSGIPALAGLLIGGYAVYGYVAFRTQKEQRSQEYQALKEQLAAIQVSLSTPIDDLGPLVTDSVDQATEKVLKDLRSVRSDIYATWEHVDMAAHELGEFVSERLLPPVIVSTRGKRKPREVTPPVE